MFVKRDIVFILTGITCVTDESNVLNNLDGLECLSILGSLDSF